MVRAIASKHDKTHLVEACRIKLISKKKIDFTSNTSKFLDDQFHYVVTCGGNRIVVRIDFSIGQDSQRKDITNVSERLFGFQLYLAFTFLVTDLLITPKLQGSIEFTAAG